MSDHTPTRFRITYTKGAYYVSIPTYAGGEVVDATVADTLVDLLREAALQLEYMQTKTPTGTSAAVLARINHTLAVVGQLPGAKP